MEKEEINLKWPLSTFLTICGNEAIKGTMWEGMAGKVPDLVGVLLDGMPETAKVPKVVADLGKVLTGVKDAVR